MNALRNMFSATLPLSAGPGSFSLILYAAVISLAYT